ncbi:MAG TPA: 2,3-bisphosphoglycerate-independent phosphoglycerate mutase [Candidatus Baltobacteraceae bacterium]|nr:2,3-bisphosphoglycerate-independent phosphoglycerate mutase [Candidatus Baltobacteraceae bacterium]
MPEAGGDKVKPVVLAICDGFGSAPAGLQGNAVLMAQMPVMMDLWENHPHTELFAHGRHVGLPKGQPGNSEAGHLNLGAGRVVKQDAVYINEAIEDGTFYKNTAILEAIKHAKKYGTRVHLLGMVSNGRSAHASMEHLYGLLEICRRQEIHEVVLHLFTDGRDGPRFAAPAQIHEVESRLRPGERIGSVMGRFYPMDRNKNWRRIDLAYHAIVNGEGLAATSAETALLQAYNRGETDEFIIPTVIIDRDQKPVGRVEDNDVFVFFNLRSDRARQLTKTLVYRDFEDVVPDSFTRRRWPDNTRFAAMTDFGPDLPHVLTAFPGRDIKNALPAVLKSHKQLYAAESEKFSHITFFFNGGFSDTQFGEERLKIESLKIPRYDMAPEMKAEELTAAVVKKLRTGTYHFVALNYANADMVSHTGNLDAAVKALEVLDVCLGRLWEAVKEMEGTLIVTADHGNVEEMIDVTTGAIETEHSVNPVPFVIASRDYKTFKELPRGVLADVAPTILEVMGIRPPEEMSGRSLLSD